MLIYSLTGLLIIILVFLVGFIRSQNAQLKREKARLDASIQSLNIGFVMLNTEGQITNVNSLAKHIFCSNDANETSYGVIHRDQAPHECTLAELNVRMNDGFGLKVDIQKCLQERLIQVKDINFGTRVLHVFMSPIVAYNKELQSLGCVISLEDITEAKVMERSKDEFFSIASHELRTPLTAIRGNTSLILDYFSNQLKDASLRELITDIHLSSVRLIDIVNDFLDTSRLEQGRIKFVMSVFKAQDLAAEVTKELTTIAADKKLYLRIQSGGLVDGSVYADQNRVKQVLVNLVGNALKFTEQGGITLILKNEGPFVKVSVVDTGHGIPVDNQKLLFRKFQQGFSSILTRDATTGTGLGLYISKLLIEKMGGKIFLESSTPSHGSVFTFTLPLSKSQSLETTYAQSTPASQQPVVSA